MSIIQINQLTFAYPGSDKNIFNNLNATFDSDWRLGLVGRNGRGKTTLLNLLRGALVGSGEIISLLRFDMFPFDINMNASAMSALRAAIAPYDEWEARMEALQNDGGEAALYEWSEIEAQYSGASGWEINALIEREVGKLGISAAALTRDISTFSPGERTRMQLAALFLRKNSFLLIDEPTNHLDIDGRALVAEYLRTKRGFMLVSHDRWFLDNCVDHICALEKSGLHFEQGNYSSYRDNKRLRDEFEIEKNARLTGEISRLRTTAREKAVWSDKVEATKLGAADRGRIGHLAAKAMKRSLTIRTRIEREIEEKEGLLKDLEYASPLSLHPLVHPAQHYIRLLDASTGYDGKEIVKNITLDISRGDRIGITGKNGAGKSTLIKLILGQNRPMSGRISRVGGLEISYMPQLSDDFSGTPFELASAAGLEMDYFLMLLRKLDFPREAFYRDMKSYSLGQKKKVLLSLSMAKSAHLYVWDEPLNYMDVESREQVENMLIDTNATIVFIEHDRAFVDKIATKRISL